MEYVAFSDESYHKYRQQLLGICSNSSPLHQDYHIEYCQHYHQKKFTELSFCITENKTCILWVAVTLADDNSVSYYGMPMQVFRNQNLPFNVIKKAEKLAWRKLKAAVGKPFTHIESMFSGLDIQSHFVDGLMKQGCSTDVLFEQYIALGLSIDALFSDIRKIFRANIRWGEKHMQYALINAQNITEDHIKQFQQLHIDVAGRETRSYATWYSQYQMVKHQEAFIIFGYLENKLVAAGFFSFNRNHCYYGVGAFDRNLFEHPISHALVFKGITTAKQLGCREFIFGETFYAQQNTSHGGNPSDKELAITHFKSGFGGQYRPLLMIKKG